MEKPRYLVCVNPEYNNNKKYELIPQDDHSFKAVWSRIDDEDNPRFGEDSKIYPAYMFWIKYHEKIAKGYKDISSIHYGKTVTAGKKTVTMQTEYKQIENKEIEEMISSLLACSRQIVSKNYSVTTDQVTPEMIKEGRRIIAMLERRKTVDAFNKNLVKLFTAIPRKMYHVADHMVHSTSEFEAKIDFETNLLDVLESQCDFDKKDASEGNDKAQKTILETYGVHIWPATDKQLEQVKAKLADGMKHRLRKAYRVINDTTQKRFDDYLDKNHIKTVKMMFHGSRDENWLSIILKGMSLNPDATITGKMFGQGLYFSPDADKSWGYTSGYGSRWAHGNKKVAYLGLFALAYGKPYNVYSYGGESSLNEARFKALHPGCNCLHARSSQQMLRKDEVIVYNEASATICYILEFDAA